MWICADCNQLVPNPVNRKCPNGHGLFDRRIFGSTKEVMATSLRNTVITCVAITGVAALLRIFFTAENTAAPIVMLFTAFVVVGAVAFARALHWRRQGGPVLRLVPRANGVALGCIAVALLALLAFAVSALRGF